MLETLEQIGGTAVHLMVPMLLVALGESINERAGVLNVGAEGMMLLGAFTGAAILAAGAGAGIALVGAIPIGILGGLLLGYMYVSRRVDQIIGGIVVNIMILGLTAVFFDHLNVGRLGPTTERTGIPLLQNIPLIGPVIFRQSLITYASFVAALALFLLVYRTWFGMAISACGSNPSAVDSSGLSVPRIRYLALIVGCVFGALGGAALVLTTTGSFIPGMTAGQGFVALAIVVLGRWNPLIVLAGALVFGLAQALQFRLGTFGGIFTDLPDQLWLMFPYIATILFVMLAKSAPYPPAMGVAFSREITD